MTESNTRATAYSSEPETLNWRATLAPSEWPPVLDVWERQDFPPVETWLLGLLEDCDPVLLRSRISGFASRLCGLAATPSDEVRSSHPQRKEPNDQAQI